MANVTEHYENLLADVYTWLCGGFSAAKARNTTFFKHRNITPNRSGIAIDLGAGSGFQSIPLAEIGFSVSAIDLNATLLQELMFHAQGLNINSVQDDLLNFQSYCEAPAELIVCMTDTINHLASIEKVIELFEKSFQFLETGGKLVLTFRDLTHELEGLDRFIPVRSDDSTIYTCFLEYEPETVKVHDLVYRKTKDQWNLHKSYYRKLKLAKAWVEAQLLDIGFALVESSVENGLITLIAKK